MSLKGILCEVPSKSHQNKGNKKKRHLSTATLEFVMLRFFSPSSSGLLSFPEWGELDCDPKQSLLRAGSMLGARPEEK